MNNNSFNSHKNKLFDLTDKERDVFIKYVNKLAKAMKIAFDFNNVNFAVYLDKIPHLHFHLISKYEYGIGL